MNDCHSNIETDLWKYRVNCEALVEKWHCLLDYQDLEAWFDSNRCCIPINMSRLLDTRIIIRMTKL